ncbi:hypothetical protein G7054_g11196 [Neopestalotiopsis clavispora]|nr:hypothetical protein G7054_g11196 [Neopestalotiopsis clavispora]
MPTDKLRVAVIGGGLAGVAVANALHPYPQLDVHVFEAGSQFSESGAAVGLSRNAREALQACIASTSISELLKRAGATRMHSSRVMLGSGPEAGAMVCDVGGDPSQAQAESAVVVHRVALMKELLAFLPQDSLHAFSKVKSIENVLGNPEITFHDGNTSTFDAVIGADGIFSTVRKSVVSQEEWAGSPSGFWDCRNLVPLERAKTVIGNQYFQVDRQYGWVGDGAYFLHDVLDDGATVQCIMSGVEKSPPAGRARTLTREFLGAKLRTWPDDPIAKNMVNDRPEAYSSWEHKSTSAYARGSICIIGDAAHAMTPWQGAGAGQAFEDAMILGALLGKSTSRSDIRAAFRAFDVIRRPRCQKIIDSSRGTGQIMCGQDAEVGLESSKIRDSLAHRWDIIVAIDLDRHREDALALMEKFQAGLQDE